MKSILLFTMGGTEWLLIALVVLSVVWWKKNSRTNEGFRKGNK